MDKKQNNIHGPEDREPFESEFAGITEKIRGMPQLSPPPELVSNVLAAVAAKKAPWWRRLHGWFVTPQTVTVVPFKWAPAAACAVLLLALAIRTPGENGFGPERVAQVKKKPMAVLTFSFEHPSATSVKLIGSFNNWNPNGYAMQSRSDGNQWVLKIEVPPGRYEYSFLVDGEQAIPDPHAVFNQSDGFGSFNSVVFTSPNDETHL